MVETTNQLVYMFAIIIDYPFYQIQRKNKKCEDHNLTSSSPWLLSLSWSDRSCASVSWPSRPAPTFHAFQSSTHRVKETMGIDGNILFIEMETIWNNNLKCLLRSTSSPICLGWYVLSSQSCRSILGQCRNPEIRSTSKGKPRLNFIFPSSSPTSHEIGSFGPPETVPESQETRGNCYSSVINLFLWLLMITGTD